MGGCGQTLPAMIKLESSGLLMQDYGLLRLPVAVSWCLFSSGVNPFPTSWNELHQLEPILMGDRVDHRISLRTDDHLSSVMFHLSLFHFLPSSAAPCHFSLQRTCVSWSQWHSLFVSVCVCVFVSESLLSSASCLLCPLGAFFSIQFSLFTPWTALRQEEIASDNGRNTCNSNDLWFWMQ